MSEIDKTIFRKKTVIFVDYYQLEKLIEKVYNLKEYSIPANEECGNDVSLEYNVSSVPYEDNDWDKSGVTNSSSVNDLLDDLCFKGIIEEGDYIVSVSW